jgi:hypothetical protein
MVYLAAETLKRQPIMIEFLKDLWNFLKERKKWWLAPLIVVLLLIGILIVLGGSSALAPFIYTLF